MFPDSPDHSTLALFAAAHLGTEPPQTELANWQAEASHLGYACGPGPHPSVRPWSGVPTTAKAMCNVELPKWGDPQVPSKG